MEQSEADKVKYWQYKLQQKKNSEKIINKPKTNKVKTPQKNTKLGYIVNQDNFFSNTISKFKGFLEENSQNKKGLHLTYSHKPNKHLQTTRSYQFTDHKDKAKKEEKKQKSTKIKIQSIHKKTKPFAEEKQKVLKLTPNKSKSRSRSKSQKYKTERPRVQISKVKAKSSISNDVSKKRSLKTKETTKRVETIMLESLEQQNSWKKKLMDTIIVHAQDSPTNNGKQSQFVSNFKIWEEHQQRQFNKHKKCKKVIQKYLKGFLQKAQYDKKLKKYNKTDKLKVDFKEIVRRQEEKLLFLKQQLSNLKNASNLNESLDFLITKVNENIYSLQNIKEPQSQREKSNHSSKKSWRKQAIVKVENSNEEIEEQGTNKTVFNQSRHSVSVDSSKWQEQEIQFQSSCTKNEPLKKSKDSIHLNDNSKQELSNAPLVNNSESSMTFGQEQSSSLRIDQKFGQIIISPLISQTNFQQQYYNYEQQSVKEAKDKDQYENKEVIHAQSLQIVQKQPKLSQQNGPKPQKSGKAEIKIEQDQEEANPVFTRSVNHNNLQQLSKLQLELIERQPKSTLFSVLQVCADSNLNQQDQIKEMSQLRLDQKTQAFEIVFDLLVEEMAEFSRRFSLKSKFILFSDIQAREKLQSEVIYQSQEEIIPEVQTSDKYILQLTRKALEYAYANKMTERLRKPLGMSSIATLKCIRRLHTQEFAQQQSNNATQSFQEEIFEQYSEVIDSNHFQYFEQHFSAYPQNPYQLIFNRSVYDTINYLLDDCRPYGSKGMPGICSKNYRYLVPSLQQLTNQIIFELQGITKLKMGTVKQGLSESEMQSRLRQSLNLWKKDLLRQIQKEYNYKEEDDTIQRCELMMQIQQLVLQQQAANFYRLLQRRNQPS